SIAETTHSLPTIPGEVPNLDELPSGCIFFDRCDHGFDSCQRSQPRIEQIEAGHWIRCPVLAQQNTS
ncbi:MAG: oligopeptide/dipeptide ABC transporter ATP-binding protein, partial [Arenicellales bacterium]